MSEKDASEDVEVLDDMLAALVDLLVEKGILTHQEFEEKVRKRIEESKSLTRFKDLED